MRRLIVLVLLGTLLIACSGGEERSRGSPPTTTAAPTTTTRPDIAATACRDPVQNADLLVSSSHDRISEAARRYREARSEALFSGDSQAIGREVTAGADLMLACEAAGYR